MGEGERYLFLVRRLPQVLISCMSVLRQSTSALCCGFSLFLFYFYFFLLLSLLLLVLLLLLFFTAVLIQYQSRQRELEHATYRKDLPTVI